MLWTLSVFIKTLNTVKPLPGRPNTMKPLLLLLALLSGCYLHQYPVTPSVVEQSTYKIYSENTLGTITGTAWVVADGYVVTAGHMCKDSGNDPMFLEDQSGLTIATTLVEWEESLDSSADLCILKTSAHVGRPLVLAAHQPQPGTKDGFVGYPHGHFHKGEGIYVNDVGSTAECKPGASGSAMFTTEGVYGVLVQSRPDPDKDELGLPTFSGNYGCTATPVEELKRLLDENHIPYDTTPDRLPDTYGP